MPKHQYEKIITDRELAWKGKTNNECDNECDASPCDAALDCSGAQFMLSFSRVWEESTDEDKTSFD